MRIFIALQFEETFKQALLDMQRAFKNCGIKGNYTKPENLHLTLAFIGEYGKPQNILDALDDIEFAPFELSLNGITYVFLTRPRRKHIGGTAIPVSTVFTREKASCKG